MTKIPASLPPNVDAAELKRRTLELDRRLPTVDLSAAKLPRAAAVRGAGDTLDVRGRGAPEPGAYGSNQLACKKDDDGGHGLLARLRNTLGGGETSATGDRLYSGAASNDADQILAELGERGREQLGEALEAIADGKERRAKRKIRKALERAIDDDKLSRREQNALVDKLYAALSSKTKLTKGSPEEVTDRLRATSPGAAPVTAKMTREELAQALARLDTITNPVVRQYLATAKSKLSLAAIGLPARSFSAPAAISSR